MILFKFDFINCNDCFQFPYAANGEITLRSDGVEAENLNPKYKITGIHEMCSAFLATSTTLIMISRFSSRMFVSSFPFEGQKSFRLNRYLSC